MTDLDTTTFNTPNGYVTNGFNFIPPNQSYSRAIALQTDGKIVMAGDTKQDFSSPSPGGVISYVAVCRYNTNGTLDNSFGTSGLATFLIQTTTPPVGPSITTNSLAIQPNGSIVVCGYILDNTVVNPFFQAFVVRFTSSGILDTSFAGVGYIFITPAMFSLAYPSFSFSECYAESIQIDTSITPNKIVIGGYATNGPSSSPLSINYFALARLDLNGGLDGGFGITGLVVNNFTGLNEFGFSLAIGSGKYFLAGRQGITTPNYRFIVAKFDNVGNPDIAFGSGGVTVIPAFLSLTVQEARSMLVQPDGKIVLAGTSYTTAPFPASQVLSYALARLDGNNGTLDTSFGTGGTVITSVINLDLTGYSVAIQTDGKIVLGGGYFNTATSLNASFSLARYNVNGSLDLTFGINGNGLILEDIVPGTILPGSMQEIGFSVAIQTDGKILVGGSMGEFSDLGDDVEFILARYFGFPPFPPPTPIVPICFPAGTPVTTDQGEINIELIDPDVHTIFNKKIVAITETIMLENNIVCFEKNSLGYNIPNKKTYISNYHGILHNGKLIQANKFVGRLPGVYYKKYNNEILYNVLMEKHYIIKINNMRVETLNPLNFVAQLYTKNYTPEEKTKLILEMNKKTADFADIKYNTNHIRNIHYTKRNHNQKIIPNYFITQLHSKTIKNYHMVKSINAAKPFIKLRSNTISHKPVIVKNIHHLSRSNKRLRR
jgi:uncharacterized delta-60 repeat protein